MKHHFHFTIVLIAVFLPLAFAGLNLHTALSEEIEPPRDTYDDRFRPPRSDPDLSNAPADIVYDQNYLSSPPAWTKLVFESYRDGNWEIYLVNTNRSGQVRLTQNNAADIQPRLNRGATQITFASNRTGNYEIYKMNTDGSGLTQLTQNTMDNVAPSWSPDGQQIIFQSYRDGQPEIYVMGADGSNQTRLTYQADPVEDNSFDGQPAWSPDGNWVAFVSKRTGGYRIFVMKSDGSEQKQLSNQAYSARPAWSPDGSKIVYDADGNDDKWQEVWLMSSDGSDQQKVFQANGDPDASTEARVGSWSPDGNSVSCTLVTWPKYNNQSRWKLAYIGAFNPQTRIITTIFSLVGADWNPDWQTLDVNPPQSHVLNLPKYSRSKGFPVNWFGFDDLSGIAYYDVQYRFKDSENWMDWKIGDNKTSSTFAGDPNSTVLFRSRARDYAYNQEAWPADLTGDTSTTLYTWQITGIISDVREKALADAQIQISPGSIYPIGTEWNGSYLGYLNSNGTHVITATKAGYGNPAATMDSITEDLTKDFWLPPTDNQVINGEFESGSLAAGWDKVGDGRAEIRRDAAYSGKYGLLVGQKPPYATPRRVSTSGVNADLSTIAVDSSSKVHIVWSEGPTDAPELKYTNCIIDSGCSPIQSLFYGNFPHIGIGPDGIVHLVWVQGIVVSYAYRDNSGDWSQPEQIGSATDLYGGTSDIFVDQSSVPHIVWADKRSINYRYKQSNGTWSTTELASPSGTCPVVYVTGDRSVHVAWGPGYSWDSVGYNVRHPDNGWGTPALFESMYYPYRPSIAVDNLGTIDIAWPYWGASGIEIHHTRYSDASWSGISLLQMNASSYLQFVQQPDNRLLLIWVGSNGLDYAIYRKSDGSWSAPQILFGKDWPGGYSITSAAIPFTTKLATAVTSMKGERWSIYYSCIEFEPEVMMDVAINQNIYIDPNLHNPTLSLMYYYNSEDDQPTHDKLTIGIDSESNFTPLITADPTGEWIHTWYDLNAWIGQSITFTIRYSQTADDQYSWFHLDEVSLGSWLTPQIQEIAPTRIEDMAKLPITIIITGGNFIETPDVYLGEIKLAVTWIEDKKILAVIPEGIKPGSYNLKVVNPEGQDAISADPLKIGKSIHFPIIQNKLMTNP